VTGETENAGEPEKVRPPEPPDDTVASIFCGYVASRSRRRALIDLIRKGLLNMLQEVQDLIAAVEAEKTESRAMDAHVKLLYDLVINFEGTKEELVKAVQELKDNTELTRLARIANTPAATPGTAQALAQAKAAAGMSPGSPGPGPAGIPQGRR
jgi:uncharacterized protein with von Willebrand factor type A (vWA) domain